MTSKILVVGVSDLDISIIKSSLDSSCVLVAHDYQDAMRYIDEDNENTLVILDLCMPNNEAMQILENLNSNPRHSCFRIMVLTQQDRFDDEIIGMRLGASDYLRKPIQKESLTARIHMHLELLKQKASQQQMLFNTIFWQAPIGIAISYRREPIDCEEDAFFDVNPMFEQITGRNKRELFRLGWAKITHPDDIEEDLENFNKLKLGELAVYSMEKRFVKPDGSIVWVNMIVSPLKTLNDRTYKHICVIKDITRRKEMEDALAESERSKSALLANIPGMAYRCKYDTELTMLFVSEGCMGLTGYQSDDMLYNKRHSNLIAPEYRTALWNEWERILAIHAPFKWEYEIITESGERKWVLDLGQGVFNKNGGIEALEGLILDISERKRSELELIHHNEHDVLTGLYNRTYFDKFLEHEITLRVTGKRAVISINLSSVHDLQMKYGINYGLDVIRKAADALNSLCTDDRVLFQLQENQFVFYVKDYKDNFGLLSFCTSVSTKLESVLTIERIGWGIGVLELAQPECRDIERLQRYFLVASEKALSDFDNDETHVCVFDQELEHQVTREEEVTSQLVEVIAGKNPRRLCMHYQPILDLKTNRICGFEALARFKSRSLGIVPPLEFIPIAEKTKLIIPLGMLIVQQSLRFLRTLTSQGFEPLQMSINISIIQLLHKNFIRLLLVCLRKNKIEHKNVMLEITESVVSTEFHRINKILNELKSLGIKVALDDFGTGHSSLARERELNVDCLKIDKCFIDKLKLLKDEETITSDIISIAHKIGHFVIAEGVEYENQMQYLKKHDCDYIQGYLISRPLDEQAAIAFLKLGRNENRF